MLYTTVVQRDMTGLNMLYDAAREFENENVLEGVLACHFSKKKLEQTLNYVRMYQARLNIESMDLLEFSNNFIEDYATENNECFRVAEVHIRRIGTTITGSMRLFRKFCPVVRKRDSAGNVVPVLNYSRLTYRQFYGQFFGVEAYIDLVHTLLHEMATFFYYLVMTLNLCKDMIRKEEKVKGDVKRLKEIFEKSCDRALRGVLDVCDTFGHVKLISEEELEEHRKNARPMQEWLPKEYHRHDKQWLKREALIHRLISGQQYNLEGLAAILWAKNPEWGRKVCDIIPNLDKYGIPYKNSKKAEALGKKGTYDAREMVYFIKWSAVSEMSPDGKKVINEAYERRFYENYLKPNYNGVFLLPSWQAVCRERKFLYEHEISMQTMANNFAAYLPKQEAA